MAEYEAYILGLKMAIDRNIQELLVIGDSNLLIHQISACSNAKEIWDAIQITHEGTNQVKRSRIEMLRRNYELFSIKDSEPIQEMFIWFTIITNELKSLSKVLTSEELVSKVLRILPASWKTKVTAIQEAEELDKISLDELIGYLKTHEMRKLEICKEEPKTYKVFIRNVIYDDKSDDDDLDIALFATFKIFMMNSTNGPKRENNGKPNHADKSSHDGCYKCNKLDHMVKDCPIWEVKWKK
ncbi:uncharacterized protein [Nicotiana sylvestris]|uniref:uncharacterized protein n=1 Tax=Nicotiana sylvestris TaxID=4096 RepID=UPI00388C62D6